MPRRVETLRVAERIAGLTGASSELLEAIDAALDPLERSPWPEVAWRFSLLTSTRHPVEFGFSSHDHRLRVTMEVAGPETPDHERLDVALGLLATLGLATPPAATVECWRALQAEDILRWGCWLGLRQTASGFGAKLYVEAPRGAPGATLRMLGYDPASGRSEFYFALPALDDLAAELRLKALGLTHARAVLGTVAAVLGWPLATTLRRTRLGVSVCDVAEGAALFFDSGAVEGGAAAVRRWMLRAPSHVYRALFDATAPGAVPDHGVVTVSPRGAAQEVRVGIAADALA